MTLSFKLNDFEGPLDLLLHLISKHKMDIFDVEIITLVDQYMEYIDNIPEKDLETAGEFLEMAARLVYIKTVMLLPRSEEEKEELKAELTGQLLEYKACKEAAEKLKTQNHFGEIFTSPGEKTDVDKTYHGKHSPKELLKAYLAAVGKGQKLLPPSASVFSPIVAKKFVSVSSRIIYLLKSLYKKPIQEFDCIFYESAERSSMVATFLAVLELIKAKRITVTENQEQIIFNNRRT